MTIVSISDAARLADVTRQTIYDRINSGTLSRTPDGIDVAELSRVYPDLQPLEKLKNVRVKKRDKQGRGEDSQVSAELLDDKAREIEWLKKELASRDEQLARKDALVTKQADRLFEKDQYWQSHMDAMRSDFQRLLEAPQKRKKILGIF